jgi:epoxyqueuosine reductase
MNREVGLTEELKKKVLSAGIDIVGVTSAEPFRIKGEEERTVDPKETLKDAQSVIVCGFCVYNKLELNILPSEPDKPRGRFSPYGSRAISPMYAYTEKVIQQFLGQKGFKVFSSANIPAKMAAVRAGLGNYGKNSLVLTEKFGSLVIFETLVTDAPLDYEDHPIEVSNCGECNICLKACPTQALYAPFKINKARCITNWQRGAFAPINLREKQENSLFGCGECVKACPKNKEIKPRIEYPVLLEEVSNNPELIPLANADSEYFRKTVSSLIRRVGIDAIRGNAIIALGNIADPAAVFTLGKTLQRPKPQIRAYSAWALGKIGGKKAKKILEEILSTEQEQEVVKEIKAALDKITLTYREK